VWGSDDLPRMRRRFLEVGGAADGDPVAEWLAPIADKHGVEFTEELLVGQLTIHQIPERMRAANDGVPSTGMSFVAYNGPASVPDWVLEPASRPRVCVTLGTTLERLGLERLPTADLLAAFAGLDVEVVVTLSAEQRDALPAIPDNVRVVDFVPLHALLPTCAAIVHHCGSGTYTTALAHGVPQLMLPQQGFSESLLAAQGLADLGVALYEPGSTATAGGLRDKLARLVGEPAFAEAARRVRDEMRADRSPHEVVVLLEELAGRPA
jgi:UDP:flavonoid glycosyltransferase YjiC (YdhE family)